MSVISPEIAAMLARSINLNEVPDSPDFRRVKTLPVVRWQDGGDDLARFWTLKLRAASGTMSLRPVQGAMLQHALDHRGLFAPARTGAGKLLTSLLLPVVLGAKRCVLIVPASRRDPTYQAIRDLSKHWTLVPITVITYSDLSQAKNHDLLTRLGPDLIVADEAHSLKDPKGARWKRVNRLDRTIPFCAMSGTFSNRDMLEYRHLLVRALGEKAPAPTDWVRATEWSRCLNPKSTQPLEPGVLLRLMPRIELDGVGYDAARSQFGRRLVSSPGVVSSGSDVPDVPLYLRTTHLEPTPGIRAAALHLKQTWTTPCEYTIDTAVDMWRHMRELACGLYYRWKVVPPAQWLAVRKELSGFIRETTSGGRYDLPSQVEAAVASGDLKDHEQVYAAWYKIRDSYVPDMVPVWIDDSALDFAAEWLETHRGIVWVLHSAFGERLSRMTKVPYFREHACDPNGVHIEQHKGPAIASVQSCSTGHNLQYNHNLNLITTCPSPTTLEQLISRTHRDGQTKEVGIEFMTRLSGCVEAIEGAKLDADTNGRSFQVVQRISYGEWL